LNWDGNGSPPGMIPTTGGAPEQRGPT
jgi:hypothetical protein